MEPAKVYKQKVEKSYHISMACLQPSNCTDSNYTSFIVKKDDSQFVVCNLHKDKNVQVPLDLMFGPGDEIAFMLTGGKNKVFLSGYVLDDDDMFEGDSSGSDDELDNSSVGQNLESLVKGKRKVESSPVGTKNKKAKIKNVKLDESENSDEEESGDDEEGEEEDDDEEEEDEEDEDDSGSESDDELESEEEPTPVKPAITKSSDMSKKKTPNEKLQQKSPVMTPNAQVNGKTPKSKKKNKTPGGDESSTTPKGAKTPETPKATTPQKMVLEGGVVAIDTKIGTGPPAVAGKRVNVYYTGRLQQNNKEFDATTHGKGFVFVLGQGNVIKGWDIGVAGMKVGGKRKIIVPAPLGYGSKGSPPVIPPNANLVFEIELRKVM